MSIDRWTGRVGMAWVAGALLVAACSPAVVPSGSPVGSAPPSATPAPSTAPPVASSLPSPSPTAASDPTSALVGRLPDEVAATCRGSSLTAALAPAGLIQEPAVGGELYDQYGRRIGTRKVADLVATPNAVALCTPTAAEAPSSIWVIRFPPMDLERGVEASADLVVVMPQALFALPQGDCSTVGPAAGRWGAGFGKAACRAGTDGAWVYWTYGSDEQLLLFAHRADGDLDALRTWWAGNRETLIRPG